MKTVEIITNNIEVASLSNTFLWAGEAEAYAQAASILRGYMEKYNEEVLPIVLHLEARSKDCETHITENESGVGSLSRFNHAKEMLTHPKTTFFKLIKKREE